jgi:hypothetical protein
MAEIKVNQQALDAVMNTNLSLLGNSGAQGQAVVYEALAHSLSLIMHNEGSTQYGSQQVGAAATTKVCAAILETVSK